jgi:Tfp pilus assembly protein PilF
MNARRNSLPTESTGSLERITVHQQWSHAPGSGIGADASSAGRRQLAMSAPTNSANAISNDFTRRAPLRVNETCASLPANDHASTMNVSLVFRERAIYPCDALSTRLPHITTSHFPNRSHDSVTAKRARQKNSDAPSQKRAAARRLPRIPALPVLALILATALAYAPALSAPFVMDDVPSIADNLSIRGGAQGAPFAPPPDVAVSGRPLVNATLAANYAINESLGVDQRPDPDGPYKTVGYRVFNIIAHLLTGALLFGVLRRAMRERTIGEDWRALADPFAGVVCALWLLHPIQTEAIDYIVQRTELLASLFYVATLYGSLRAWDASSARSRFWWYAAAIFACLLGTLSKEIVISAPLAVILYDRAFRFPSWSAVRGATHGRIAFYIALAVVCVSSILIVAAGARGGSAGFSTGMPWYAYFYSQCWAIAHYLRLVVWPNALTVDYGPALITGLRGVPGLILLTALAVAVLAAWTRVPKYGWFAFAGSMFFMLLAPSSSVVPIAAEIVAERRIYLALAAVIVVFVVAAESARRRFAKSLSVHQLWMALVGLAAVFAVATATRSYTYSTSERLWRDSVKKVPANPRAYSNLGSAFLRQRPPNYAAADTQFRLAMALDTTCHFGCGALASVLAQQGRIPEATALYERALHFDPNNAPLERRYALMLMKADSFSLAIPHIAHVASAYPTERHLVVLAVAYFAVRHQQDGIAAFDNAARMYPGNAEIRSLGGILATAGRADDAVPHLKELALVLAKDWQ